MSRFALAVGCILLGGCATSSLVLLPDDGGGHGAVAILEADGVPVDAVVNTANSRTGLGSKSPATKPLGAKGLSKSEQALVTELPPPARSFSLYFEQGTTRLTPESASVLDALRAEIASRSGADVEVTGHTDTVGGEDENDQLSMRRAEEVVTWLAGQGFDRSMMSAVGRGERELKEPTVDNVENAANRRVEVTVR